MARFYLHLKAGRRLIRDDDGFEAENTPAAQREAVEAAREILADAVRNGVEAGVDAIVLMDEGGQTLNFVPLSDALPVRFRRDVNPNQTAPSWALVDRSAKRSARLVSEIHDLVRESHALLDQTRAQLRKTGS